MAEKSKFAAQLRKLGFELFTKEEAAYCEHRTERRLHQLLGRSPTRNERRIAEKTVREPTFIVFENNTVYAHDELGNGWRSKGVPDLTVLQNLGFRNVTLEALAVQTILPALPPEKTQ